MILLCGASASGKTEVAKILFSKYGIRKVVTHTTRPMRDGEKPDVDYHFVDKETFLSLKGQGHFVETTFYHGNFYGTSFPEIGDDKVLIVDPNGLKAFLALNNRRIVTFFMDASPATRFNRMIYRGDSVADARRRIENDEVDFDEFHMEKTDFTIDTGQINIEQVANLVYELYTKKINALD